MKLWISGNFWSIHARKWADWFHAQGHEVRGFAFAGEEGEGTPYPVETVPVHGPPGVRALAPVRFYRRRLSEDRPDIVDCQGFTRHALYLNLAGARPFTMTLWGSDVLVGPRESRFQRAGLRFACRRAARLHATSREIAQVLEGTGCPTDRVWVRGYGIHVNRFPALPAPNLDPVVIQTRTLEPIYNVEQIVEAAPRVLEEVPDARFILLGDGSLREALEKRAVELGCADRLEFRGTRPYDAMAEALREARLYVTASRSDSTPSSLMEALSTGLVPAVSAIPAHEGWVNNGEDGVVFPLDDPEALARGLVRALTDDDMAGRALARGPPRVRERGGDFEASMRETEAAFQRIAGTE